MTDEEIEKEFVALLDGAQRFGNALNRVNKLGLWSKLTLQDRDLLADYGLAINRVRRGLDAAPRVPNF